MTIDWVEGDALGLALPANADALRNGGGEWLSKAFRASGALGLNARVARITDARELAVGGTGAKMLLSVEYEGDAERLPADLFVKFSRNFQDPVRDVNAHHMRAEVKFAALSREPSFPITVPQCLFTDFNADTDTGLIITDRIAYGQGRIEPQIYKCMDHLLPDALGHYRAIVKSLAKLAGSHKAGKLGPVADRDFPLDTERFWKGDRNPYKPDALVRRVQRLSNFVSEFPCLFPAGVDDLEFLRSFVAVAPTFLDREDEIKTWLHRDTDYIALCHWNANIDNGWFWREDDGSLGCGLIDWGSVGQIHLGMALWGCLSGAEPELWDEHLDELLQLFITEYRSSGGPQIDSGTLAAQLDLYVMTMGLAWLMEAPVRVREEIPDPSVLSGPHDPLLAVNETSRVQLKIIGNVLNLWRTRDLGRYLQAGASISELAAIAA